MSNCFCSYSYNFTFISKLDLLKSKIRSVKPPHPLYSPQNHCKFIESFLIYRSISTVVRIYKCFCVFSYCFFLPLIHNCAEYLATNKFLNFKFICCFMVYARSFCAKGAFICLKCKFIFELLTV